MILLDTHAFIWTSSHPDRLSRKARAAIHQARASTGVYVSTMSLLEFARLAHVGRIFVAGSMESILREMVARVIVRPMTPEIVASAVRLPATLPTDPADRVIVSTALIEGMPLVTA